MNNVTISLLEKHFDIAFAAPDGIKKLRELILTLAMQGKLVAQDPNDQPASELLKEIDTEKQRLVKEGKIKQPKPLSEIKSEDVPYDLPKSWEWVRLGTISIYIQRGIGPSYSDIPEIPVISQKCIQWSGFNKNVVRFIDPCTIEKYRDERFIQSGDLLWNSTGTGTIGRINIYRDELNEFKNVVADSHVTVVRVIGLCNEYVLNFLMSPTVQNHIEENASGTTNQIELNTTTVNNQIFPLPPLAEQRRIVAKIDELMARCDELEKLRGDRNCSLTTVHTAALNRLLMEKESSDFSTSWSFITQHFSELYSVKENVVELRKAILQLAVMGKLVPQDSTDEPASELLKAIVVEKQRLVKEGKLKKLKPLSDIKSEEMPYELPKGWEWVRVIDIVDVGTGSTPATTNSTYYNGTIPWYTSSATNNIIAEKPETFITESAIKETNCKIFPSGSLIIAMYGQGKTRGQISEIVVPGATNQAIAAMVFYESSQEIKIYIKYYFVKIYDEIRSISEGGAQPNLNVGKIKETLIPLPPLTEQHRIVGKIDQLMWLCDRLEQQIDEANSKQTALLNVVMAKL
jgi:type I restriction enzyme, S subunit